MVTRTDLSDEYSDQFVKQVEEKWNKSTEGGYRPEAMELAKRLDEMANVRDLEYILFLKEFHRLRLTEMVITFLKGEYLEALSVVAECDEKALLNKIRKGRVWDDSLFTAIAMDVAETVKGLPSALTSKMIEPIASLKVKVESVSWDRINTVTGDIDNWNVQRVSWVPRMARPDVSKS